MARRAALLLAALPLVAACAAPRTERAPRAAPEAAPAAAADEALEARALLLLMADRRQFDLFTVERIHAEQRSLWPELALTLGRIGDSRGRPFLEAMMVDDRAAVRRRAVFALGRLGDREAVDTLLIAVADVDRDTGRRAIEALARLEVPLVRVVEAALRLEPDERWARLCPELFRFPAPEVVVLAGEALAAAPGAEQGWAIYALARRPVVDGRELLRLGLLHQDPAARAWAARGLGAVGEGSDLARLRILVDEPEPGPVIQALRAAGRLIGDGRGAAPRSWIDSLLGLLDDERVGVRLTAVEVSAHWLLDPRLGDALARRARQGAGRERQLALVALGAGGDPRTPELASVAAADSDPALRAAAATAAARFGAPELVARLEGDRAARVRMAALTARLEAGGDGAALAARRGLIDGDAAVRATALEWLAENPRAPLEEIGLAIDDGGDGGRPPVELLLDGVAALAARATAVALERGAIIAILERLALGEEYAVRRAAADALAELGRPRPLPEPIATGRSLADYRGVARRSADRPRVAIETTSGVVELVVDRAAAPLTSDSFLQLANQGFYDGTLFHRVVADFVVQGGDPRADGWGGPGFTLRDEPNLVRYERGVLGMARSAPDTAGSQFFITLSPQPHLDGDYTAFGRVVSGSEVLDRIEQGDRIERIRQRAETGAGGR